MGKKTDSPSLAGEPGWTELEPFEWRRTTRSFVSDEPDGDRIRVRFFTTEERSLSARVWFGPMAEGPPNHAHGGSIAAVLDEVMGYCAWAYGHPVVLAQLNIGYRASIPLREVITVDAQIRQVEGRKVWVGCTAHDDDGTIFNEGEGLFVSIGHERFAAMMKHGEESARS